MSQHVLAILLHSLLILELPAFSTQGKNVHQQMDNANAIGFLTQPTCQTLAFKLPSLIYYIHTPTFSTVRK